MVVWVSSDHTMPRAHHPSPKPKPKPNPQQIHKLRTGEDALGVELELALVRLDRHRDGADVERLHHGLLRAGHDVDPVEHVGPRHGLAGALLAEAVLRGVGVVLLGAEPAVLLDPLCGWVGALGVWRSGGCGLEGWVVWTERSVVGAYILHATNSHKLEQQRKRTRTHQRRSP